jgi:hypothetical protein
MKKKNINKKLVITAVITFITVLIWGGVELFISFQTYEVPKVLQEQKTPINPNLDKKVIEQLKNKKQISQTELEKITQFVKVEEGLQTELEINTATNSAEEQDQQATTAGQFIQVPINNTNESTESAALNNE